jgi:hypothetical protein
MDFQVGDIVEFGGIRGVVFINTMSKYPVSVVFDSEDLYAEDFTIDGRLYEEHISPLLVLIERPKKKIKKTIDVSAWMNVYNDGFTGLFKTELGAEQHAHSRIACAELKGSYEIEVEEEA